MPRTTDDQDELLNRLTRAYFRHAVAEDLADRSPADRGAVVAHHLDTGLSRRAGTAIVRVLTPSDNSAVGRTVVEVVTDDMPFLVDSVTMALDRADHVVHLVLHPQLVVRRDREGRLSDVVDEGADQADTSAEDLGRESWMHIEIDRLDDAEFSGLTALLEQVLADVRAAVEDWPQILDRLSAVVRDLEENPQPVPADEVAESAAFLRWLGENHFTFLGYREYRLEQDNGTDQLRSVPGTGLGILHGDDGTPRPLVGLPAAKAREKTLLVLTKANTRATVHRSVHLDYVGVKVFDERGDVIGERRFLGLFSSAAYAESVTRVPLARVKARQVIEVAEFDPMSHAAKSMLDVLESYPRDELFATPASELGPIAETVMHTRERRQLKLFVRPDTYGRFWSVLVFLPRDRYNTTVRERIAAVLLEELDGDSIEYTAQVGSSFAARLHLLIRPRPGIELKAVDQAELEQRCATVARSWREDLTVAVVAGYGEKRGAVLARRYSNAFPEAYKEDYPATAGAEDLGALEEIEGEDGISLALYEERPGDARLKLFRVGEPISLSRILPILTSMGTEVIDERPYQLDNLPRSSYIYDFGLRYGAGLPANARDLFADAVAAVWSGHTESDGFNALVLAAGITWRQAMVLRAYARHQRQAGTPFAQESIEDALRGNVDIARYLVALFEARFDPASTGDRRRACRELNEKITTALDDVHSLDDDRILRGYLTAINATLRTNYYQPGADGEPHPYLALKFDPQQMPELPEPRPKFEIFVYSPRVEGVHLRFGSVARGGLRWSDRRDDFRSEVLGLVKAQMVKNTVIVPVGAKGGFYPKNLPDPSDRDAWMAEGIACYRTFISALLDLTDNLVESPDGTGGSVVEPARDVVRHDPDDTYLVVAADKGTATFSDIANEVAASYGFWLGDAFASGGSVGYDHKAMGITARGAWVSVRRHFREMGIDCQDEDITCVGIGDMSGDVFGNGMLCSEHIRLVAAFDHRDIFLDPAPIAAVSYAERKRLFTLPRSSWKDYNPDLISEGGGVFPRSAKSIPLSPQVRESLGTEATSLTPAELIRTILLAPADLLWNGGIGTYVKSAAETDADAADKANDAIRVNGAQLRVRCVGEGGNLGFTQRGRIEYATKGAEGEADGAAGPGRINTDFIDNSAGVDTSDHEVNIKILLDRVIRQGSMTGDDRNQLLASMTDQVAELVLADNDEQNLALANAESQAAALLHVHEDWMRELERRGLLNRELEALPSRREVARRIERAEGLCGPELSVLLAYTKIVLADELLGSGIAEDPFLRGDLYGYFPLGMRQDYRTAMEDHPLRNEIVVTRLVNQLVNDAGVTYLHRLAGETGAEVRDLTVANFLSREIFGARRTWDRIATFDYRVDARLQTRMRLEVRTLVERASRWLVNNRRLPLDSEAVIAEFEVTVEQVMAALPVLMTGAELAAFEGRRDRMVKAGVSDELATQVAVCPPAYMVLGVVQSAARADAEPLEVARLHFGVGEVLGLPALVSRILALPRNDRWQTMARATLRDDLHSVHAQLTSQILATAAPGSGVQQSLEQWEAAEGIALDRAAEVFVEICKDDDADLARMSVALRVLRSLLATP